MMHESVMEFGKRVLTQQEVTSRQVLEVGALNVNGSLRAYIEAMRPARYIGVDVVEGPGVDLVLSATALIQRFGFNAFDLVVCTEMLEHCQAWWGAVRNLKAVLAPWGVLLLTTRSKGFARHHEPDYWRFELADLRAMFDDMEILALEPDPGGSGGGPGVFLKACKPAPFYERNLASYKVYSMEAER